MATLPGPVALVGSGEFLPVMEQVDRDLLRGRPPRAAILPTAASLEGDERVAYWLDLGQRHYQAMGVEPVPVPVRTRADADDPAMASAVRGAGLVYLSGGDPHYLCTTLRSTAVWAAVLDVWASGAALAGCSAGAMALTAGAPSLRGRTSPSSVGGLRSGHAAEGVVDGVVNGLEVVPTLAVMPHFDRMRHWEGAVERFLAWRPAGTTLVGIEEETALVGDGASFEVAGRQGVWVFGDGPPRTLSAGQRLTVPTA